MALESSFHAEVIESGFYVCIYEKSFDELAKLSCLKELGYRWQGVVLCRRNFRRTLLSHADDPGEYEVALNNNIELFGDPHMISQILSIVGLSRKLDNSDYQQLQTNSQTPSTVPRDRTEQHR